LGLKKGFLGHIAATVLLGLDGLSIPLKTLSDLTWLAIGYGAEILKA
jgi:hypothetical protein